MSRKNRLRVYNELVTNKRLHQDDGALVKEFGVPESYDGLDYPGMPAVEEQPEEPVEEEPEA